MNYVFDPTWDEITATYYPALTGAKQTYLFFKNKTTKNSSTILFRESWGE